MNMQKVQKGFTLIELMIVVAIIGILAAIAIPQYQNYVENAKLSAAASTIASMETAMANDYQTNGAFPDAAQLTTEGTNVPIVNNGVVTVTGGTTGVITYTFNAKLSGNDTANPVLIFTATPVAGASTLQWVATQTGLSVSGANYVATKLNGS